MSTQIPDPVSVGNRVEVVTPNQAVAPVGRSADIQRTLPAYRYHNPISFRNNFISNSEFRSGFVDQLFERQFQMDPASRERAEAEPDAFRTARANAEARMLNEMYMEVSTGEDLLEAISRRGSQLAANNFNPSRVPDYVNVVRALPQHYEEFNVTDGKNLLEDFSRNPNLIGQLVQTDERFRDQVYRDRFNVFLATLEKSHNRHGIDTNDPNSMAKGFAIFENYGSEGLTQYVNYFQRYNPNIPLEEQDISVRQAHAFFSSSDFQGESPRDVVSRFIGSVDSPDGVMSFQPRQLSAEVGKDIPADLNAFSRFFNSDGSIEALVSAARAGSFQVEGDTIQQPLTTTPQEIAEFRELVRNGTPSRKAGNILFDIMAMGRNGEGFTQEDMFATIAVHATPQDGERGAIEYVFNPDELPENARIAFEALQLDQNVGGAARAFRNAGNGMIAMEPDRQRRLQSQHENFAGYRNVTTERVPVYDDSGRIVGYENGFNPRFLSFDYPNLLIGRAGQFLNDYMITPMIQATAKTMEFLGNEETADAITSSDFFTRMREAGDFDPYDMTTGFIGGGGGALMLTDLSMYIASALNIGRVVTAASGAAIGAAAGRAATAGYSTRMSHLAGQFLQSSSQSTRWQAQARNTGNLLTGSKALFIPFMQTEIGAATLEVAGGSRRSMLANPFVDDIMGAIGVQSNIERTYAVSDNLTRMGLDALGSVAIGFAFDNIWAGMKYGGNIYRTKQGKLARGLDWDPSIGNAGDYVKGTDAVFAPEWRRFMHNALNGLQEMPLGSLADTQANLFLGRQLIRNPENVSTLEDALGVMNHQFTDFFGTLRDDIELTIRHWDREFGGSIRYTDDIIARRTDELFNETVDKIADGIVSMYRYQDPDKRNLITTIASSMKDQGPSVRSIAYIGPEGKPRFIMDGVQANTVASVNENAVIREVAQPDGSIMYTVDAVDENFWGVALGDAILRRYARSNVDDIVERNARRLGFGDELTPAQQRQQQMVSQRANEVVGKEVVYQNQRGYIVDFDARTPDVYTIRGIDGIERQAIIPARTLGLEPMEIVPRGSRLTQIQEASFQQQADNYQAYLEVTVPVNNPGRLLAQPGQSAVKVREDLAKVVREDLTLREFADEIEAGLPFEGFVRSAAEAGVPEVQIRTALGNHFDREMETLQRRLGSVKRDKRIKNEDLRASRMGDIAEEMDELSALRAQYEGAITDMYGGNTRQLADDAFVGRFETPIQRLATVFRNGKLQAKRMRDDARLVSGRASRGIEPTVGPYRKEFGLGQPMISQIARNSGGQFTPSIPAVRRLVTGLGSDNNLVDNITKIAYNKGRIEPLRATDIKKHTAVVYNGDLYMARQGIKQADIEDGLARPSVWIPDENYGAVMNPYWARVNRNATTDPVSGQLTEFVREGHGTNGPIYREATPNDPVTNRVFLNIQQPIDREIPFDQAIRNNVDAIRTYKDGIRRFEVFNEADQAIAVSKVHQFETNFGLRSREVKSQGIC